MKLLTKADTRILPSLYAQEYAADAVAQIKFFIPGGWTWYATEGQVEGTDFLFFRFVVGPCPEWGYFCLSELESVRGPVGLSVERDLHFEPAPMSDALRRDGIDPAVAIHRD
jgi:hypothetical protein